MTDAAVVMVGVTVFTVGVAVGFFFGYWLAERIFEEWWRGRGGPTSGRPTGG